MFGVYSCRYDQFGSLLPQGLQAQHRYQALREEERYVSCSEVEDTRRIIIPSFVNVFSVRSLGYDLWLQICV